MISCGPNTKVQVTHFSTQKELINDGRRTIFQESTVP
uniref:Uncharacterized protein n=1 Tax=Rhizophora mucronata TaxID=61149 RepID=A0A2P2QJ26_RHIMU